MSDATEYLHAVGIVMIGLVCGVVPVWGQDQGSAPENTVSFPEPERHGETPVERALAQRRSVRRFLEQSLTLEQLGQLLWAAQGLTDSRGFRTAPSAGALYPLEVLVLAGDVAGVPEGVYRYHPGTHSMVRETEGDHRQALAAAALEQAWVAEGAAVLVIAAEYSRTTKKYGIRGERYAHIEVGHVAQNVYLQAQALDLGTAIVGAFRDAEVKQVLQLGEGIHPLAIMPVGRP